MLNSFGNKYRKLDMFGRDLKFEEDETQSFRTNFGATLTLFMFIIVIILGILFGREIYERNLPIVLTSNEIVDYSQVDVSEFPIIFFFKNIVGQNIEDITKYIDVEVTYIEFSANNDLTINSFNGIFPCNPDNFPNNREYVEKFVNNSQLTGIVPYCVNLNNTFKIQNQFAQPNSSSIIIKFDSCWERPSQGKYCPEDTLENTQMMYIVANYMNSYFNPKNYSDPIYFFHDSFIKQVGNGMISDTHVTLSNDEFESDNGWILEDIKKSKAIKVAAIKEDLYPQFETVLLRFIFETSRKKEIVQRSYMKVQELFAKIGGLFNACSIIFNLIIYDYVLFKFRVNYFKYAYEDIDSIKNNNKNNFDPKHAAKNTNKIELELNDSQIRDKNLMASNKNLKSDFNNELDNKITNQSKTNLIHYSSNKNIKISKSPIQNLNKKEVQAVEVTEKIKNLSNNKMNNENKINNYVNNIIPETSGEEKSERAQLFEKINSLSYNSYLFERIFCCTKKHEVKSSIILNNKMLLKKFALSEYLTIISKKQLIL